MRANEKDQSNLKGVGVYTRLGVPVAGEVITGGCLSMSLIKSLVIFSSSSTSLIVRGAPPEPDP